MNFDRYYTDPTAADQGRPWQWSDTPFSFVVRSSTYSPFVDELRRMVSSGELPSNVSELYARGELNPNHLPVFCWLIATHLVPGYSEDGVAQQYSPDQFAAELAKPEARSLGIGILAAANDQKRYRQQIEAQAVGKPQLASPSDGSST